MPPLPAAEDPLCDRLGPPTGSVGCWTADCGQLVGSSYDLTGSAPDLAPSVRMDALMQDMPEVGNWAEVEQTLGQLTCPAVLVRAPIFISNHEPPMYTDAAVAAGRRCAPQLNDILVPGVNHYTIVLTRRGAEAVADVTRERLTQ